MIFVIDIGNTTVALAGVKDNQILFAGKVDTNRDWDADTYAAHMAPLAARAAGCRGAILSSVVPQATQAVADAAELLLGTRPMILDGDTDFGLTINLPEPHKVGRDRLVDAVWAAENMPLPAVTADLGTATTLNVILPGPVFAGGVICAGILTGLGALADRAAQLPRLQLRIPDHVIGKNTEQCMLSGAVIGTAGMLDGLVQGIEEELGTPVSLVLTGGGGEYVTGFVRHAHILDRDLTLKGLALVYARNRA